MNNKIIITNKPRFNDFMKDQLIDDHNVEDRLTSAALISINDTHGQWSVSWFNRDHPNVLRLWFDDVENDNETSPTNKGTNRAFTEKQAQQIIDFALDNRGREFIIHCTAGISRSGAVGQFLLDFLNGDKEYFKKTNPHINPNGHISRILNRLIWESSAD